MKLTTWLKRKKITPAEFARRLTLRNGRTVHESTVSRLINGLRDPSFRMLQLICDETSHKVGVEDFYGRRATKAAIKQTTIGLNSKKVLPKRTRA